MVLSCQSARGADAVISSDRIRFTEKRLARENVDGQS